jgi:ribosome-associated translation inhibitor RaiA
MTGVDVEAVVLDAGILPTLIDDARAAVGRVAGKAPGRVLHARVTLDRAADPAVQRPAIAKAGLDVNGRLVRAHVAARTIQEAIDLLEARLRDQLEHLASQLHDRYKTPRTAAPGAWRHGTPPAHRPDFFPRAASERDLVRHRVFAPAPQTVDEALLDLDLLDADFHLFTEVTTGHDAVVQRCGPDGYGLSMAGGAAGHLPNPVRRLPAPAVMTVADARRELELAGMPFVFFVDAASGRGSVAYRRHDGHDGLIEAVPPRRT